MDDETDGDPQDLPETVLDVSPLGEVVAYTTGRTAWRAVQHRASQRCSAAARRAAAAVRARETRAGT